MEAPKNTLPNQSQTETKLHFLDYWRIIRIRKTVILAVFLLVVLTTTAVTFILPETYMSTARIEVGKDTPDIGSIIGNQAPQAYDPYFIQTEFEKIKSQKVLNQVIKDLNLREVWAKRYGTETLRESEAYKILVGQIDLRQSRNTSLIEIRAFSDVKQEAADIANKIAEVYRAKRTEKRMELSENGIAALQEEYNVQKKEVEKRQKAVDDQRIKLGISDIGDAYYQSTIEQETVRNIEKDRLAAQARHAHIKEMADELHRKSRKELRKAIPTAAPDTAMDRYLGDLAKVEQQYAANINDLGPEHPEIVKLVGMMKTINQQIEDRIEGVLAGIDLQVAQTAAVLKQLEDQFAAAKKDDTEKREKYAPYFIAKRDLENQQRI